MNFYKIILVDFENATHGHVLFAWKDKLLIVKTINDFALRIKMNVSQRCATVIKVRKYDIFPITIW